MNKNMYNNSIKDLEYVKEIIEDNDKIKSFDNNLKRRIINICDKGLEEINKRVIDKEDDIKKLEKIIFFLNNN